MSNITDVLLTALSNSLKSVENDPDMLVPSFDISTFLTGTLIIQCPTKEESDDFLDYMYKRYPTKFAEGTYEHLRGAWDGFKDECKEELLFTFKNDMVMYGSYILSRFMDALPGTYVRWAYFRECSCREKALS
jgi:hypothetical protein